MNFPKYRTKNISIEKARRVVEIKRMCKILGIDKDITMAFYLLLECAMDDAYAVGRLEKCDEIAKEKMELVEKIEGIENPLLLKR